MMKKLIFLITLVIGFTFILYSNSFVQMKSHEKPIRQTDKRYDKLKGIGYFIIDDTQTNIISKVKNDVRTHNYQCEIKDISNEISELKTRISKRIGENIVYKKHYCPDLKVLFISKFYIGGIELNNIELSFYNDSLFKMQCDYSRDLVDGLIYKYGNGKEYKGVNNEALTNKAIASFRENIWENDNVFCKAYTSYAEETSKVGERIISKLERKYFIIKSKTFDYQTLEKCEKDYENKYMQHKKNNKYKGL